MINSSVNLELISVHVPKTAGTTFGNLLQQSYGKDRVFLDYPWLESVESSELQQKYQAIHGHFAASKYRDLPPNIKRITWIRNPIDRLISHYFYWKTQPISPQAGELHRHVVENQLGLLDFARIPSIENHITQWYIDLDLHSFYFVGIHEFFEEDCRYLMSSLGFSHLNIKPFNPNRNPEYIAFKKSTEYPVMLPELMELNSRDIQIYQWAIQKRYERALL